MGSGISMQKETAFRKNTEACRKHVLGLDLSDVFVMTGITPPTMRSYERDESPVSPFLSTAKKIADAYGTTVERLCSYDIFSDAEEVIRLQADFLKKAGARVSDGELYAVAAKLKKIPRVTRHEVLSLAVAARYLAIRRICRDPDALLPKVFCDERIVTDFTYNLRYLTDLCDVSLRKMSAVTGVGAATLGRLKQGAEPTLSAVIRLSDYFGVGVGEMLSPGPSFPDPAGIIGRVILKKTLSDTSDPVPGDNLERDEKSRAEELGIRQAGELLEKLLIGG